MRRWVWPRFAGEGGSVGVPHDEPRVGATDGARPWFDVVVLILEGTVQTVPAGAERGFWSVLLINAGRLLTASALMDALWGEDLPGNAANALQGRISRLHGALADAGLPDAPVTTRRPGSLADAHPERVDAHIRRVQQARRRADQNASVEAIGIYDEAHGVGGDPRAQRRGGAGARHKAAPGPPSGPGFPRSSLTVFGRRSSCAADHPGSSRCACSGRGNGPTG